MDYSDLEDIEEWSSDSKSSTLEDIEWELKWLTKAVNRNTLAIETLMEIMLAISIREFNISETKNCFEKRMILHKHPLNDNDIS